MQLPKLDMDLPTWNECSEKQDQLDYSDRTIAQCVMSGSELTPLEEFIYSNEPAHPKGAAKEFRSGLIKALNWATDNV